MASSFRFHLRSQFLALVVPHARPKGRVPVRSQTLSSPAGQRRVDAATVRLLSNHHLSRSWPQIAALVIALAVFYVAGGVGMAWVAGLHAVRERLLHAHW
jgi:hypothetical protein